MDSNKDIVSLPLVQARLEFLLNSIYSNLANGNYNTQERINAAVFNIIRNLSEGVDKPIYNLPRILPGSPPNRMELNSILVKMFNELRCLTDVLYKTGSSIESNFNFAVSKIRKLNAGLKECEQELAVYSLYVKNDINCHNHGDTFSTKKHLDLGSKFLSEDECLVNFEEGTVSLPLEAEREVWPIKKVSLGERSNCVLGNNVQRNTPVRGRINAMHDGNVDSWTEFERIVSKEDDKHLILELKISLEDVKIVNGIRIIPVSLGARTPVSIDAIQYSRDGRIWKSLKNDISVVSFLDEKEEDRYHLSPHTGKFSGEFNITFDPKFIKFFRIVLRQCSAFRIEDNEGNGLLRYAIGIKELEFSGVKYKNTGELISNRIDFTNSIRALALNAVFDPKDLPPEAGGIEYFVSFDDGTSWDQMSRQTDSLLNIPEIVFPPEGQTSFRYKVRLAKDEAVFASYKRDTAKDVIQQIFGWADTSPLKLLLSQKPAAGTLTVCDPDIATVGSKYPKISIGRGASSTYDATNTIRDGATVIKRKIPLPASVDTRDINLEVDGTQWTKIFSFAAYSWHSKVYMISKNEDGTLEAIFGNGDASAPKGMIPGADQEISVWLSDEQLEVENNTPPYNFTLKYPSDGIKQHTKIYFVGGAYYEKKEVLPHGEKQYRLRYYPVRNDDSTKALTLKRYRTVGDQRIYIEMADTYSNTYTKAGGYSSYFNDYKDFVDGHTELENAGDWTVDFENGWIYFYSRIRLADHIHVSYYQDKRSYLRDTDWDFVDGSLDKIKIYESGFDSTEEKFVNGSANDKAKDLPPLYDTHNEAFGVVPKSVRISESAFGTTYPAFEVPFIDGIAEFAQKGLVDGEEISPVLTGIPGGVIRSFTIGKGADYLSTAPLVFSDSTVFVDQQDYVDGSSELGVIGYWSVNPNTGTVYINMDDSDSTSGITVSYLYEDESNEERMKGAFSVNSEKGVIHFAMAAVSSYTIYYKLAPFKIRYSMSYQLEEGKDYTLDKENREITVTRLKSNGENKRLLVSYKSETEDKDLLNLADYFSPLLRGLAFKAALL